MDDGGGGLTKNQESILNARRGEIFSGESGWKVPLGFVGLMSFVAFILGCVSTDMARTNSDDIEKLSSKKNSHPMWCSYGDQTFGEEVVPGQGSGGSSYQLVGVHSANITWMQAYLDAKSRCYNGHSGYLAIIGTQEENDFIHDLIHTSSSYEAGDDAWIGATDTGEEGSYAWIGPGRMGNGQLVFYEDEEAVDGSFVNWADGEPNDGGSTGTSEDCVAMYGGGEGKWYDKQCYLSQPFFVVEFGPPDADVEEVWKEEHKDDDKEGELDDDAIARR